jgi:hypothetical protein
MLISVCGGGVKHCSTHAILTISDIDYTFFQVSEDIDWTRKPVIGKVEAVDADLDLNALLYYSIIGKIWLI